MDTYLPGYSDCMSMRTFDCIFILIAMPVLGQGPPAVPERPWHSPQEQQIGREAQRFRQPGFRIDADKIYSLAELIDLAEAHNPQTRVAWESAVAQAAALGVARSELYPTLSAIA